MNRQSKETRVRKETASTGQPRSGRLFVDRGKGRSELIFILEETL